jgi:hypothetical protein
MTRKPRSPARPERDPVVDRVRAARARLWSKAGASVAAYLAQNTPPVPKQAPTRRRRSA